MKVLIAGLGTQGQKRKKLLKNSELIYTVDSNKKADFIKIEDAPINDYDTVFLCVPEGEKLKIINFCIKNSKNILVEKPLSIKSQKNLNLIEKKLKNKNILLYTAYNLRFEKSIITLKKYLNRSFFGKIYNCRMFYGNGTAKNIRLKKWRDKGNGVLSDLGSHLFDLSLFFFGNKKIKNLNVLKKRFENNSPDYSILRMKMREINLELVSSFCSWKNTFCIEIFGQKGSAKIESLAKWGKPTLKLYKRKLPSGIPSEKIIKFSENDTSFESEHKHFSNLIKKKRKINLTRDKLISKYILSI